MRKWTLVALLGLGVIIAYIDRTNLAIALASTEFQQFFALSDTGRGVLNSVFFWSYTVMQIPVGLLVDRFGVKRPLAISFVLWCMVAAATAAAGAFWELVALRLMLGVAEAALFPAGLAWLAKNVEERQRGLAVGHLRVGKQMGTGHRVTSGDLVDPGLRLADHVLPAGCRRTGMGDPVDCCSPEQTRQVVRGFKRLQNVSSRARCSEPAPCGPR